MPFDHGLVDDDLADAAHRGQLVNLPADSMAQAVSELVLEPRPIDDVAGDSIVMAVVRGDHEINPVRLARTLGVDEVFLAAEEPAAV